MFENYVNKFKLRKIVEMILDEKKMSKIAKKI